VRIAYRGLILCFKDVNAAVSHTVI
jgi:hypothetical protein